MRSMIRQFPLASGVVEGADPKLLPPGALLSLVNSVWRKEGRVEKRFGTRGLTRSIVGGGELGAASRLFTRGRELCVISDATIYSLTAAGWQRAENLGKVCEVGVSWSTLQDGAAGVMASDLARLSDGRIVHAWVTGDPTMASTGGTGQLFYQVLDPAAGTATRHAAFVGPGTTPTQVRVLAIGDNWVLVWNDAGDGRVRCSVSGAPVQTVGGAATSIAHFDAAVLGSEWVLAVAKSGGGITLSRYTTEAIPTLQATADLAGESDDVYAISVDVRTAEDVWLGYFAFDTVGHVRLATARTSDLATQLAPTEIETLYANTSNPTVAVLRTSPTACLLTYACDASSTGTYQDGVTKSHVVTSVGDITATRTTDAVRLLSRPFALRGRYYQLVASWLDAAGMRSIAAGRFPSGADAYLIELPTETIAATIPHRYVAHVDVLTAGAWRYGAHANVVALSDDEVGCVMPCLSALPTHYWGWKQNTRLVRLSVGAALPEDMWRSVELGDETYLSGGYLTAYDGRQAFDYGFAGPAYLDMIVDPASPTGGSMAEGRYLYATAPEYRSAAGVLHRGPSCPTGTVEVTTNTGSVELKIIPVLLSHKQPDRGPVAATEPIPVVLPIYRTTVNGVVLHRLTVDPTFNTLEQAPAGSPQVFVDTRSDANIGLSATLGSRPALYTAGGELDDYQPPASTTLALHRNRLWIVSGDRRWAWLSKDYATNPGVAPGFHPSMRVYFPEPIVALASMDEKLVALSAERPWYVLGDGPAPNGDSSDLTTPTPVQADVGCASARSVVTMPDGVMFVSARGFQLLTRGLELVYVGRPVEDTLRAFPVVTSAVVVPAQNQVRWTCNSTDGATGCTIVFDYASKQWCVFRHSDGENTSTPIADAILWGGRWTFVTPAGKVYQEDPTTHLDDGALWVQSSGALAWLGEGGPLGFQHVRRAFLLGDRLTDCDLTLKFGFNHRAGFPQAFTWRSDRLAAFGDGANVGMRVGSQHGASPRCRAFRVAWEDAAPTGPGAIVGTGAGVNVSAFGIEYLPLPEMARRSAKART